MPSPHPLVALLNLAWERFNLKSPEGRQQAAAWMAEQMRVVKGEKPLTPKREWWEDAE